MSAKRLLYRFVLYPVARIYWRLLRPKTFGARLLITDPTTGRVLLIRQCYGRRDQWTMPGGGYRPQVESAESAAVREVYEETGVRVTNLHHLAEDVCDAFGNSDVRQIFTADLLSQDESFSPEIEEMRWVPRAEAAEMPLARITELAFAKAYSEEVKIPRSG